MPEVMLGASSHFNRALKKTAEDLEVGEWQLLRAPHSDSAHTLPVIIAKFEACRVRDGGEDEWVRSVLADLKRLVSAAI